MFANTVAKLVENLIAEDLQDKRELWHETVSLGENKRGGQWTLWY